VTVPKLTALKLALVLAFLTSDSSEISTGLQLLYDLIAFEHGRLFINGSIALAAV